MLYHMSSHPPGFVSHASTSTSLFDTRTMDRGGGSGSVVLYSAGSVHSVPAQRNMMAKTTAVVRHQSPIRRLQSRAQSVERTDDGFRCSTMQFALTPGTRPPGFWLGSSVPHTLTVLSSGSSAMTVPSSMSSSRELAAAPPKAASAVLSACHSRGRLHTRTSFTTTTIPIIKPPSVTTGHPGVLESPAVSPRTVMLRRLSATAAAVPVGHATALRAAVEPARPTASREVVAPTRIICSRHAIQELPQAATATLHALPSTAPGSPSKFARRSGTSLLSQSGIVLCFGDSLTAGGEGQGQSYPSILEDLMQRAGHRLTVVNGGIWGETVQQLLDRMPHTLRETIAKGRIDCVLVLGGTNDLCASMPAQYIVELLRRLHDFAGSLDSCPHVGVLTVPPAKFLPGQEQARLSVNEALRASCRWPSCGRRFLVDLANVSSSLAHDGIHYTPQGYNEFANSVFHAMERVQM